MKFKQTLQNLSHAYLTAIYQGQTEPALLEQFYQKILKKAGLAWKQITDYHTISLRSFYQEWIKQQEELQQSTRLLITFAQSCLTIINISSDPLASAVSIPHEAQQAQLADTYLMALYQAKSKYPASYQSSAFQMAINNLI